MLLTTICYLEKNGKYLMLHRTKKSNDINQGKWIGVGGKFEKGESPEQCMIREVKEETGLSIKKYLLRGIVSYTFAEEDDEYMFVFTSNEFEGELSECDEGELAWVEKEEVTKLNLWEGDKIFLEKLKKDNQFFSMKCSYKEDELIDFDFIEY